MRPDQHDAGQRLSRRRAPGGQLFHGAADRRTPPRETGIDRLELRRRNHIKPTQLPYRAASEQVYDSGDFPTLFKRALELADWKGFARRKRESRKRGRLRGIGIGSYLEVTAPPSKEMGGARFEADGTVTFITGTLDHRAGPRDAVRAGAVVDPRHSVRQDSAWCRATATRLIAGGGTGGSRSITASGAAMLAASALVIERGKTDRRRRAGGRRRRYRVRRRTLRHRRHRPLDRHPRARRAAARRDSPCPATCRSRSTSIMSIDGVPSVLSQRLPRRRGRDRSRHRRGRGRRTIARSTTSAPSSIRCWSTARSMAASCRASARSCMSAWSTTPTASS